MRTRLRMMIRNFLTVMTLLLIQYSLFAQNENSEKLADKFQKYQTTHFQEKLFVHTDKPLYLSGEQIWLKVYVTDALFHKPSNLSKVAYVEITDKNKNAVIQAKVALEDGKGDAAIRIPVSVATGNYIMRGYTQWMKNYSPDFYFEQQIEIINTINENLKPSIVKQANAYDIQFFPEGGNLLNGISTKVAYKAINQYEQGVNCSGSIINLQKDTIARFSSLKFGMGNFSITPSLNERYTAIVQIGDTVISKDLPAIVRNGFMIAVKENTGQQLKITVQNTGGVSDETVYLFIHSGNHFKEIITQKLLNGKALFLVDKMKLEDGISHFMVFNGLKEAVCERLWFKSPINRLQIAVHPSAESYQPRDSVQLQIHTKIDKSGQVAANVSLSVFLTDSITSAGNNNDILSYLLLSSDLKGNLESPGYYLDQNTLNTAERAEATDNLMLTQGWSKLYWNDWLHSSNKQFEFLPETEGPLLTGKITDKRTGLPAENIMAYLSVPGLHFKFTTATSNNFGDLLFNPGNYYESNEIIVQTNNQFDSVYRINITDPFSDQFSNRKSLPFSIPKSDTKNLLNRSIAAQSENIFHKSVSYYGLNNSDTLPFYGNPDNIYFTDAYTRFTSMEEVIKEYVGEIRLRQVGNKYRFTAWNSKYKLFNDEEPLVLIDGVPVFSTNKMISFDPLKIKKIEVITQNNFTGALLSNGVLSFTTYNGDLAGFPLDANAFVLEYEGIQRHKEFYTPLYQTLKQKNSRIPDMRNVLYWSPNINTDNSGNAKLQFYTSDLKGKYAIVVQGITKEGVPGYTLTYINTK